MDYKQPDFYSFSQDSIELANLVAQMNNSALSCLDLGSGSGVVGIEIANKINSINSITLLELQTEFYDYLQFNSANLLNREVTVEILISSFANFKSKKKYDLIVGNLPYFIFESSRPSKNLNRDKCRRWVQDSILDVLKIVESNLADQGIAFLILDRSLINFFEKFHFKILKSFKNVAIISVRKETLIDL